MRITFLLLTVLTAFSLKSYSQSENDSLLYILNLSAGIEKINILNSLADRRKLSNTEAARLYAQQAAELADSLDYTEGKGYALQILGFIDYLNGNFNTAIRNNQDALAIADKFNDMELMKRVYEVLALVYEESKVFDKSLLYFQYAYEQNNKLDNPVGMGLALMGAGRVYDKLAQYGVALNSNRESLTVFQQLGNNIGIAKSSLAIAKNYFYLDLPDSGSYFFKQAENIILDINSNDLLLDLYLEKVEIYAESHIDSSLYYIRKATNLAERLGRYYLKRDLLLETSELYTLRGEYQVAYNFHQAYSHLNDSLLTLSDELSPGSLALSLNDAIYSEQQSRSARFAGFSSKGLGDWLIIGFGLMIIGIAAILIWLAYRYKIQQKSLKKMGVLQKEIENLSSEIIQKEKLIVNLKVNKNNHLEETGGSEVSSASDEWIGKKDQENADDNLLEKAMNTFIASEWRKLDRARSELSIEPAVFYLDQIKQEDWNPVNLDALTLSVIQHNYEDTADRIRIHHIPDPAINLFCHAGSMLLLIHNLLRNSIESIDGEGDIFIDYFSDSDKITYRIIDTGNGITPNDLNSVVEPFFSTRKSDKHLGLGLTLCREIVKIHNAVIKIKSKPETATEVTLEFYYT